VADLGGRLTRSRGPRFGAIDLSWFRAQAYADGVTESERTERLAQLAADARAAEVRGEGWVACEAWGRYELVRDGGRDPDELLAEGIALSRMAITLAGEAERGEA